MNIDISQLRPGLLHNPHSGANRKGEKAIDRALQAYPELLRRDIDHPPSIVSALGEFAAVGVNLIVVNGGDGTVQAVLTALLHESPFQQAPLLALLHAGSTSMTAADVGLRGKPPRALNRLMRYLEGRGGNGKIVCRQVLRVRTAPIAAPLYGMACGTGAVYQGVKFYHNKLHRLDLRREVGPDLAMLRFLWALARGDEELTAPSRLSVSLDGQPERTFMHAGALISTLERLLLGIYPFWGEGDGPLHYTALRSQPRRLLRRLPWLLRGRAHHLATPEHGYMSVNVGRVAMRIEGGFMLDGEIFQANPEEPLVVDDGGEAGFFIV